MMALAMSMRVSPVKAGADRDGYIGVHVRFRAAIDRELKDYVTIFERAVVDHGEVVDFDPVDGDAVVRRQGDRGDWMDQAMAILARQLVEHPEPRIPSVARL